MIIGLVGRSMDPDGHMCSLSAGKDSVANNLVKNHKFVKIALADHLKRFCQSTFDFTDDQMWGPSEFRNAPDKRYPREHTWKKGLYEVEGGPLYTDKCLCCGVLLRSDQPEPGQCYLTPRYALQTLGTEWARGCVPDIWVQKLIGVANEVLVLGKSYSQKVGTHYAKGRDPTRYRGVVVSDVRFDNELTPLKKYGAHIVLIVRKMPELPNVDLSHASEADLNKYTNDDPVWDEVIDSRDLPYLVGETTRVYETLLKRPVARV